MNSRTAIVGMGLLAAIIIVALQTGDADNDWRAILGDSFEQPDYQSYSQEMLRRYPRPPLPNTNPNDWLEYPQAALYSGFEGRLSFTVTVDPFGEVIGCEITKSSGIASLDAKTCSMLTASAYFYPALDKDQQPIKGLYSSHVRFEIDQGCGE